jgi:uncharacterized membrane protein
VYYGTKGRIMRYIFKIRHARSHMKILPLLVLMVLVAQGAFGATLSGIIYDLSFDEVKNTIVEITTEPKQVIVAKEGTYSFEVPPGTYTLTAKKDDLIAIENITVTIQGNYTLDLILFPSFSEEDELLDDLEEAPLLDELETSERNEYLWYFIALAGVAVFNFIFMVKLKKTRKSKNIHQNEQSTDTDVEQVIKAIKDERGRTTQKEIRKRVPLSEAKISLILTELEQEGKIKKYKKGRSNIIIFKEPHN